MKVRYFGYLICLFCLIATPVLAGPGASGMTFLKIGHSARAIGMGDAFCAMTDGDAAALYWNPASASYVKNIGLSFTYTDWLVDTDYSFMNGVKRVGDYGFGLTMTYFNGGEFERREEDKPTEAPDGTFTANDFAFGITVSRQIGDDISLGVTGKFVFEKIEAEEAKGVAADFGVIYEPGIEHLKLGFSLANVGQKMKFQTAEFSLPSVTRAGLSYQVNPITLLAVELNKANDSNMRVQTGLDVTLRRILSLRAGYKLNYDNENYTLGGGVAYQGYRIDYAFLPHSNELGDTHHFSLNLAF